MGAFTLGFMVIGSALLAVYVGAELISSVRRATRKKEWPETRFREMGLFEPIDRRQNDLPYVGNDRRAIAEMMSTALGQRAPDGFEAAGGHPARKATQHAA
jgi:hypothetical protein